MSHACEAKWDTPKEFLLARYPNVQNYGTLLAKVNGLKRKSGERLSDYATHLEDSYTWLMAAAPGGAI